MLSNGSLPPGDLEKALAATADMKVSEVQPPNWDAHPNPACVSSAGGQLAESYPHVADSAAKTGDIRNAVTSLGSSLSGRTFSPDVLSSVITTKRSGAS